MQEATLLDDGIEGDSRKKPEYVLKYKQAISANDAFLGMSGRDPSSMSCEELVITVQLPNTKFKDVKLDVTRKELLVQTPTQCASL